jgi:hypothetical protein
MPLTLRRASVHRPGHWSEGDFDIVAADLARRHGIAAGRIPAREWRRLYVAGLSPRAAADRAQVQTVNRLPAPARVRRRLRGGA